MKQVKLNIGSGKTYLKGWINVDNNKSVKADVYADITKKLPFKSNYTDLILLDNVLEHVTPEKYFKFLEELHRVCKPGARIIIYVPHFSGMYATKHATHYNCFGIGSFDIFRPEGTFNGERYSKARFELVSERLLFFHHKLQSMKFLSKLPINWLFNCCRTCQLLCERFQIFNFDEIKYQLSVVKS